jgi:nucleoside phosphorylase
MLNLTVALPDEARQIIHHHRLKRLHHVHAFPVYGNDELRLIVSGIGNLAAATATGYLAGMSDVSKNIAWLNVGIAGSKNLPVGDIVLAHKISDVIRQQHFYPTFCFEAPCSTAALQSVAAPQTDYRDELVYDMEAAGFYAAAMRFSTSELVHCIKIISDNDSLGVDNISRSSVAPLVAQSLPLISEVIGKLSAMTADLDAEDRGEEEISFISSRFYFTVSQQAQLKTIMQNWFALTDTSPLAVLNIDTLKTSKVLLQELQRRLDALPVKY